MGERRDHTAADEAWAALAFALMWEAMDDHRIDLDWMISEAQDRLDNGQLN